MKMYQITRDVIKAEGWQSFRTIANSAKEAMQKFKSDVCFLYNQDISVEGLDEIDVNTLQEINYKLKESMWLCDCCGEQIIKSRLHPPLSNIYVNFNSMPTMYSDCELCKTVTKLKYYPNITILS